MGLNSVSLRARSAIIALVALILFTPIAIFAIDRAYAATLKSATLEQLKLTALMLISEFNFEDDAPNMPIFVYDEKLNLSESGVYGYIRWKDTLVWQSASTDGMPLYRLPEPPETGQESFIETNEHFIYSYTAEFETDWGFSPVYFSVLFDQSSYIAARRTFLKTLWGWMGMLNLGLLVCLIMGIRFLLRPLSRLRHEIKRTTSGSQSHIKNEYPKEIAPLTNSINLLIDNEYQQRERYKNSLSDLAHSLKTPLTVALGEAKIHQASTETLEQPLFEIKAIIDRQLKRASTTSAGIQQMTQLAPLVGKLIGAMKKVHADKSLTIEHSVADDIEIMAEQTDLMECLGNLFDNACKAATSSVALSIEKKLNTFDIHVDDDGPGIPENKRHLLLTRGNRLDNYQEGQGIGLALVVDIMSSYAGNLVIGTSPLGGARMTLCFNCPEHSRR